MISRTRGQSPAISQPRCVCDDKLDRLDRVLIGSLGHISNYSSITTINWCPDHMDAFSESAKIVEPPQNCFTTSHLKTFTSPDNMPFPDS
jgi:hypothetical protein